MPTRVYRALTAAVAAALAAVTAVTVAVLPAAAAAAADTAPGYGPAPRTAPADWPSYLVTVRQGVDPAGVAAQVGGVRPDRYFHHTLNGFAARLSPQQVADVAALPGVLAVEADGTAGPA